MKYIVSRDIKGEGSGPKKCMTIKFWLTFYNFHSVGACWHFANDANTFRFKLIDMIFEQNCFQSSCKVFDWLS